ncbi:MAG: hypothetical protein AAGI68_11835 [Planctomycetota bacterium]
MKPRQAETLLSCLGPSVGRLMGDGLAADELDRVRSPELLEELRLVCAGRREGEPVPAWLGGVVSEEVDCE